MQRAFSGFPSGPAGLALLALRVTVGTFAILDAASILALTGGVTLVAVVAGTAAGIAGFTLIFGFLTPIAGALLGAEAAWALLSGANAEILRVLGSRAALVEFAVMSAALVALGPGAVSVDARMFGRREVCIPD